MNRDFTKAQRRRLRELGGIAYERELSDELTKLESEFKRWRGGQISPFELSDTIHRFHQGPSRRLFSKYDGSLGETVAYMFDRLGQIQYPADKASADEIMEAAIEAGADDVQSSEAGHDIFCKTDDLIEVRDALEKKLGPPLSARFVWRPQTSVNVEGETAATLIKLIEALDDHDDVQQVYSNFEMSEAALAKLIA